MAAVPETPVLRFRRRIGDRIGDVALYGLTAAAAAVAGALLIGIAWKVFEIARPAITKFGFGFITRQGWDTIHNKFETLDLIWGTAITSFIAVLIPAPVSFPIAPSLP